MFNACNRSTPETLWRVYAGLHRPISITDEDVECLIVTAFEGGINYWCDHASIVNPLCDIPDDTPGSTWAAFALLNDGHVFIYEQEENGGYGSAVPYGQTMLTLSMIERGFQRFIATRTKQKRIDSYLYDDNTMDMGMVDAIDADMILQYALWDHYVYG